jgi:hypothetical protein
MYHKHKIDFGIALLFRYVFVIHTTIEPKHSDPEQVFIPAVVSHMNIANVHVGIIDQNLRIALQFSYEFAIFISVCNFHISLQFSRFGA